ncbi:two-component regulator propeller domain-containing protein [Desertivirga brevis]|uniref:two-component regulator propeller domain-containing protein n=1 Tax=Desertivirga brevis TaxID=2810310 RepID=UPI001A9783B5|nr:two-component regulator propeller domain-containing protein [Pedobacter sp. SYSU D00873]
MFRTLFWVLSFLSSNLTAQEKLSFEHYTVAHGLSQNSVLAITQDPTGYIWLGTRYCLNKYDSRTFKIYKSNSQLTDSRRSNEYVHALLTDSKGSLWVGTRAGLNVYQALADSFITFNKFNGNTPGGNYINCLFEDQNSNVWIGTNEGLARLSDRKKKIFQNRFIYNGKGFSFKHFKINAIFQDHKGVIWLGTHLGLLGVQFKGNVITSIRHFKKGIGGLTDNNITALNEDKQHRLWLGTLKKGLFLFNNETDSFSNFSHSSLDPGSIVNNYIRKIFVHKSGKLWLATQEGLSIFDPQSKKAVSYQNNPQDPHSLNQNSIYDIYEDSSGSIWLGTYYGGVNVTHFYNTPFNTIRSGKKANGISSNVISSMCEDASGNLWIGTEAAGVNYLNVSTGNFVTYNDTGGKNGISSNLIKWIYKDRDNKIWLASHQGGINYFDKERNCFDHLLHNDKDRTSIPSDDVTCLLEDSQRRFWVGTEDQGLCFFNKDSRTFTLLPPAFGVPESCKYINWIYEDSAKNIWVGASNGTYVLFKGNKQFLNFFSFIEKKDTPPSNIINSFREDSNGNLWLGAYFGGLYSFSLKSKRLNVYTVRDGLPTNNIVGILEGKDGILWLSTDNGLSRFDSRRKEFINYNTYDGLPGNVFSYNSACKARNGKFYFGSHSGLVNFYPDSIRKNTITPKVVFTGLSLFNKKVIVNDSTELLKQDISLTKELKFDYDQNSFSIDFAILNFIKPAKNKFAYRLEGFEEHWNFLSTPSASYTNLNPGTYTLIVKATNNDGVWNEAGRKIKIIVTPPYWMTWWFRILVVLMICLGAYLFYCYRINRVKKQKIVLERLVAKRTSEVVEKADIITRQNEELFHINNLLKEQADEITRMNVLLERDNKELSVNIEKVTRARVMSKDVDFEEFSKIYPDKETCFKYLSDLKWDKGYKCRRCSNEHYFSGHLPYSRRCTKCRYEESVIAYTIFQNSRIAINKAFYMLFLVYSSKGKISSHKLSEILSIRQSTCWSYSSKMKKVLDERKKELKKDPDKGWTLLILDHDENLRTVRSAERDEEAEDNK